MAITKTRADLIGTSGSKTSVAGGATATSSNRDASALYGITVSATVVYGASIPATDPYVEVFTSPDNTNFDTEAFETFYIPRLANATKMVSIPLRFVENIKYYQVKITNGATNSITCWVSSIESTL